jgi:hypothetical protein
MVAHLVKCSLPPSSWHFPTHLKLCSSKFFVCVDAFGVVTKGCCNPTNPLPLSLLFSELLISKWNGENKHPNNVAKALRTQVATNTFDDIINKCNKLTTSPIWCANLELQSSKLFSDGVSLGKVTRTCEGGQTLKACH